MQNSVISPASISVYQTQWWHKWEGCLSRLSPFPEEGVLVPQLEEFFRDCCMLSVVLSIFYKSNVVSHLQFIASIPGMSQLLLRRKENRSRSHMQNLNPVLFPISPSAPSQSLCGGRWVYSDNLRLHRFLQCVSSAQPSAVLVQCGLLGNLVLLLKASLPAEPYSSFWNKCCPVNSIWRSLPGLRLVEQEHFQCICFPIL